MPSEKILKIASTIKIIVMIKSIKLTIVVYVPEAVS